MIDPGMIETWEPKLRPRIRVIQLVEGKLPENVEQLDVILHIVYHGLNVFAAHGDYVILDKNNLACGVVNRNQLYRDYLYFGRFG